MVTIYTCVMVLFLMVILLTYSTYSSRGEQRESADDLRQKQAFHAAQAGIDIATEWFGTQSLLINVDSENVLGESDGFLFPGAERWTKCADVNYEDDKSHPCWGDPNDQRRPYGYFYDHNGTTHLPIDTSIMGADVEVEVEALLCFVFVEDLDIVQGLTSEILGCQLLEGLLVDNSKFMVTLLSRGQAACSEGSCAAEALISQKVTNFSIGAEARTPAVPLVSSGPLPATGLLQLGANDDIPASPLSIWGNANPDCGGAPTDYDATSLLSCPVGVLEGGGGSCPAPTGLVEILEALENGQILSATGGLLGLLSDLLGGGTDLLGDEAFPCDIFGAYFGVGQEDWQLIRDSVMVIDDCSVLDADSHGTFWITGENCEISGPVGSANHPVMIISAASSTYLAEDAHVYGTIFAADVEDASATLTAADGSVVQGQLISDSAWGVIEGTATVWYDEDLIVNSGLTANLGQVQGTWTDFHKEWE